MKKYVVGFLAGILFSISATVFAEDIQNLIGKKVQAEYVVEINGQALSTVVVEGKNYAPVRSLGEAAGYKVDVNGKKVTLTKPQNSEYAAILEQQRLDKIESLKKGIIDSKSQLDILVAEVDRLKKLQAEGPKEYDKFDYEKGIKNAELQVTRQQELIKTQEENLVKLQAEG
jgi:hypothetical protein